MAFQMKYIDIILQKIFGSSWAIQISQFLLILLLQTTETGNIVITGGYAELTYSAVYDVEHNDYHRVENFDFMGRRHSGSVFLGETLFTFGGHNRRLQ